MVEDYSFEEVFTTDFKYKLLGDFIIFLYNIPKKYVSL